jgi:ribosomal protein S16
MKTHLTLKLCRFGRKHRPFYRLGVIPAFRHPSRKFALEYIGWYNPVSKEFKIQQDRFDHYKTNNIAYTDSVKSLLTKNKIIS